MANEDRVDGSSASTSHGEMDYFAVSFYALIGLSALFAPIIGGYEFEGGRSAAIALMWKSWIPGALTGVAYAMFTKGRGQRSRRNVGSLTALGLVGYVIAAQSEPRFLGAFFGFMSGVLVAFAVTHAVMLKRREGA